MKLLHKTAIASALVLAAAMSVPTARADAELDCKLNFDLTTWSAIYKHAEGSGTVTCENGQSMPVVIKARGGGLTVGKSHIDNGHGRFTDIHSIGDVLGNYAQAEAHAGLVKSGSAQVLTKGNVSLALAGDGEGVDLGVDVAKFTISPAKVAKVKYRDRKDD
jgi:hypothetical protein